MVHKLDLRASHEDDKVLLFSRQKPWESTPAILNKLALQPAVKDNSKAAKDGGKSDAALIMGFWVKKAA